MATYYEILGLPVTASVSEVEVAVETQYNKWRRLVTHHDPTVADEANRALRTLEQIRATLTDPAKRAVYDQSLNVGGLADPEALLKAAQPAPTATPQAPSQAAGKSAKPTDAWICGKCQLANAVGLQFCSDCGNEIGRTCPQCQRIIAITATFCAHCGGEIEAVLREQADARIRIAQEEAARCVKELREQIRVEQDAIRKLDLLRTMKLSILNPFGEAAQVFCDTVGFLAYLVVLGWSVIALLGACALLVMGGNIIERLFFCTILSLVPLLLAHALIYSAKPELNRRVQAHMVRIAELEQNINEIKRTGLSNL